MIIDDSISVHEVDNMQMDKKMCDNRCKWAGRWRKTQWAVPGATER
jgi:hypothetical protein